MVRADLQAGLSCSVQIIGISRINDCGAFSGLDVYEFHRSVCCHSLPTYDPLMVGHVDAVVIQYLMAVDHDCTQA